MQAYRLFPPDWKGFIPFEDGDIAVLMARPSVPLIYLYGLVGQQEESGAFTAQYPNIVRVEATAGMTIPVVVEDGWAKVGLRAQRRLFVNSNTEAFDALNADLERQLKEAFGPKAGHTLIRLHQEVSGDWKTARETYLALLRRYLDRLEHEVGFGRTSYEIPGGYGRFAEKGQDASKRQFYEETDPNTAVIGWGSLGEIVANRGHEVHTIRVGVARVDPDKRASKAAEVIPDPYESFVTKLEWYDLDGLDGLREEGKLICGITEAALGRYLATSMRNPNIFPPLR